MMGGGMMGWGGGMGLAGGGILTLLFWIALIVAAVAGVRWLVSQGRPGAPGRAESSIEILKRRYASGEIGREEFEMKKRDLQ